jgi:hypothetical protein
VGPNRVARERSEATMPEDSLRKTIPPQATLAINQCDWSVRPPAASIRVDYSDRSASNGSTQVADRAGM